MSLSIENILEQLSKIKIDKREPNTSFVEFRDLYLQIFNKYQDIKKAEIKRGTDIFRVRKNYHDLPFSMISELSYPPKHLTYYGRMNVRKRPIYYCSDKATTSILEAKPNEKDHVTLIESTPLKDLLLIVLGNCNRYKITDNVTKELKLFYEKVTDFITEEIISGNEVEYLKTGILSTVLSTDDTYDGFIYPSIYSKQNSDNIAIKTNIADSLIQFKSARQFEVIKKKNPNNLIIKCIAKCEQISVKGAFIWEKVNDCNSHEISYDEKDI